MQASTKTTHSLSLWRICRFAFLAGLLVAAQSHGSLPSPDYGQARPASTVDGLPRILVDASVRFQTITGWEATAEAGHDSSPAFARYADQLYDMAVNDLGVERLRVGVRSGSENSRDTWSAFRAGRMDASTWRSVRHSTINDNDDPFVLNEQGFWFPDLDGVIEQIVLPIKQRLESKGRRLFLNLNYTGFTEQIGREFTYHHSSPEEYAEFVEATYRHLRTKYGLTPDAWEIQLEPDNSVEWDPVTMRRAMVAAGNRLEKLGVTPRFIAPSTTSMMQAIVYADEIAKGDGRRFWSELSYHRYRGVSKGALREIAARARRLHLSTAMLEHIGSGYEDLHDDLKIGLNSAWQQYTLGFPTDDDGAQYFIIDDRDASDPRVTMGSRTPFLRQYFKYVRRGATRINSLSSDRSLDPLAFVNEDGKQVIVIKAEGRTAFSVEGLAPGSYEVSYATPRESNGRAGVFSVIAGEARRLEMPDRGVLTLSGQ